MNLKRVVEQTTELGEQAVLRGVQVGEHTYDLFVTNSERTGRLSFRFSKPDLQTNEFSISIGDGKLTFHRTRWRPNHDHDDTESLQITKDGKLQWWSRFPYSGEGREFFDIPFGSIVE